MKKIVVALTFILAVVLTGCNTQIIDTTYKFDRAVIAMPDGTTVSGKVSSWKDYDDSEAVQVVIDGVTYYTFIGNVVLISD